MTDVACAHPRLEGMFYQTISLPDAAVDMVYCCPDCDQTFAEWPGIDDEDSATVVPIKVDADDRFVLDAADLPF